MAHVDSLNRPLRGLAGLALPAGALLVLLGVLLHPAPTDDMQATGRLVVEHPFWGTAHVLHLLGGLLALGGFVALGMALRAATPSPAVPLFGAGLAAFGLLLHGGAALLELFVAPGYASAAATGDGAGQAGLLGAHTTALTFAAVGTTLLAAGGVLLAALLGRVEGVPRWTSWSAFLLLPFAALVSLAVLPMGEPLRNVALNAAVLLVLLWAGAVGGALLARQPGEARSHRPREAAR